MTHDAAHQIEERDSGREPEESRPRAGGGDGFSAGQKVGISDDGFDDGRFVFPDGVCERCRQSALFFRRRWERVVINLARDEGVAQLARRLKIQRRIGQVEESQESAQGEEEDQWGEPGARSGVRRKGHEVVGDWWLEIGNW